MIDELVDREIDEGSVLRAELDDLQDNFTGFGEGYNAVPWKRLLDKMIAFDNRIQTIEIRYFLFGYIARCALNCHEHSIAVGYAKASIMLNMDENDQEGVNSSLMVLCDLAASLQDYNSGFNYYKQARPLATIDNDQNYFMLSELSEKHTGKRASILDYDVLPDTYQIREKGFDALRAVRYLAERLGVTEQTALKYFEAAKRTDIT